MSDNLIILTNATFNKAQIIATRLESEGIECYLRNIPPAKLTQGAVKVFVKVSDLDKAFSILKTFDKDISF